VSGGEGGIRTPDTGVSPYNGLANRRLQPLGHLSGDLLQFNMPVLFRRLCSDPGERPGSGLISSALSARFLSELCDLGISVSPAVHQAPSTKVEIVQGVAPATSLDVTPVEPGPQPDSKQRAGRSARLSARPNRIRAQGRELSGWRQDR
jgi:hypothetical protein